ncbi:MAG: SLC13 family permease [Bacteroidaceae bacterium]
MTAAIVVLLIIGYILIATENFTNINKAAVAMFVGVVGWILYMCDGTRFVMREHALEFTQFLAGGTASISAVKEFIAQHVFLKYITKACEIILFMLATMTIVEVLNSNGCFDFIAEWFRTRNTRRLLWSIASFTFLLSANLDNFTTTSMMLVIMHSLVTNTRHRMMFGSVILIAATCGGAFTVIGDVTSLALWVNGAITPTAYSASLVLPTLVALVVPTYLIGRKLPVRLDTINSLPIYHGNDALINRWQRLFMLAVGIGGLWFIPTFHRITHLSPFVGALCVLSLLWVVNEFYNRKLLSSDQMVLRRLPIALQYGNIQTILFFIGITLAIGAIKETGALHGAAQWCNSYVHNIYIMSLCLGAISSVLDSIVLVLSNISIFPVLQPGEMAQGATDLSYSSAFTKDGSFWSLLGYCSALGGCVLTIGSMSGYALMKMEKISIAWYIRHISGKVILGWLLGLVVYLLIVENG